MNSATQIERTSVDSRNLIPSVTLLLKSSDTTKQIWEHDFELRLTVTLSKESEGNLGGSLDCRLQVSNVGRGPFKFSGALHTYLNVLDIRKAAVHLEAREHNYRENATGNKSYGSTSPAYFKGEVDRSIFDVGDKIQLEGFTKDQATVEKSGFPDAVVWNPHIEKSAGMADLEDSAWMHFVCVEPAIANVPITLEESETWVGRMRLS